MIRTLMLAAAALAFAGCASHADEPMTAEAVAEAARAGIAFVDHDHITTRQDANPDLLLLDVRTGAEFARGHIPGARSMPRGVAEFRLAREVRDADAEIIVYCATGNRAALVKKALDAQGYRNVSAHPGFESWAASGRPIENDYGTFRLIERAEED